VVTIILKKVLILTLIFVATKLYPFIVLDNFEQNNDIFNTLWNASGIYAGPNSSFIYIPDTPIAVKIGNYGAYIAYTNLSDIKYWNNFSDNNASPVDLSGEDKLNFWIRAVVTNKGYPRKPRIDYIILEGTNYTIYGRVNFATYNGGSSVVSTNWTEISIPIKAFTNDKAGGFTLTRVKSFVIKFTTDPGAGNITVDDFEQNNGKPNSSGYWSDVWYYTNSKATYIPDTTNAYHSGSRSGFIIYTNRSQVKYYNNFRDSGYISLTNQDTLRFWIKANPNWKQLPRIDKVILEGTNYTIYGRVNFATYNGGSSVVSTNWTEIAIPLKAFTNDKSGGFKLSQVKSFALTFITNSGSDFITLDDFEQNNGNVNTRNQWSDCWTNGGSKYIYSPDITSAAKVGTRGAQISYTNKNQVKYFNNFTNTGYISLKGHHAISFWIRAYTNNPAYKTPPEINYVILEGTNWTIYGRVPFSNYNRPSGCQIGAFVGNPTASNIDNYETLIQRNLASVMWYINFQTSFPTADCNTVYANGSVPHIVWEPYTTDQKVSILDDIISGAFDSYIQNFATQAKNWGHRLWIRWGHEMNGNWYGWSGAQNGGGRTDGYGDPTKPDGPEKYVDAYKHVWTIFSNVGATNVYWIWSVNCEGFTNALWNDIVNYYPGDKYVDWMGISGYNWVTNTGGTPNWKSFSQIFNSVYNRLRNINWLKPIMISEMACGASTYKSNWIREAFDDMKENYPQIKAYFWFNVLKERDWRVNSNDPSSTQAMRIAMTNKYFLSTGDLKVAPTPKLESVWKKIEIPLSHFTNDKSVNFSLTNVKSFALEFRTNRTKGCSLYLDEIKTVMTQFSGSAFYIDDISATSSNAGGCALFIDEIKTITTNTALPRVLYTTPTNNQKNVFLTKLIKIGFSKSMNQSSFNSNTFRLSPNPGGRPSFLWNTTSTTLTYHIGNILSPFTTYTLRIKAGSSGVKDSLNLNLDGNKNNADDGSPADDYVIKFTTIGGDNRIIWYDDEDGTVPGYKEGSYGGVGGANTLTRDAANHLPLTTSQQFRGADAIYFDANDTGGAAYWYGDIGWTRAWKKANLTNARKNNGWVEFWIKGVAGGEENKIEFEIHDDVGNTKSTTVPLQNYIKIANDAYRKVEIPLADLASWPPPAGFDWFDIKVVQFNDGNVNGVCQFYVDEIAFVDPTPDTTPPKITFIHPWSNAQATWKNTQIIIQFNENMWKSRTENAISIIPDPGPKTFTWKGNDRLYISFSNSLVEGQTYTVKVSANLTNGACDVWGNALDGNGNGTSQGSPTDDYVWSFRVGNIPMLPTIVTTNGYRLMVRKRFPDGSLSSNLPFRIKGMCYDPAFPGETGNCVARTYVRDAKILKDLNANCIRTYWPWNGNNYFDDAIIATNVLNEFYYQGIYVVMYVYKATNYQPLNYTNTINAFKNHPAILMWSWGNEPNASFNNYWGYGSIAGVRSAFQSFCQAARNLDPNHLPTTAWWNIPTQDDVNNVPSCPIWGFTDYRGYNWIEEVGTPVNNTNTFKQWSFRTSTVRKPMFLAERGCDRYITGTGESALMQNRTIFSQFKYMAPYFSESQVSSTNVNVGDFIFELFDDWRKAGNPSVQDTTAQYYNDEYTVVPPGDTANPNMQEEWWGIMDVNANPKTAYNTIKTQWREIPDHFKIVHDGIAQESQPELITIYAMDKWGFPIINYTGVISLFTRGGTPATINWYNTTNNKGKFTNTLNGTAKYTFSSNDRGVAIFKIVDSTVESINIEVISKVTSKTDDDTEGWLKIEPGPPSLNVEKTIYSINIGAIGTNSNPPISKPKPGATITYKIKWTNSGLGTATSVKIYDDIPSWGQYLPGSMKFSLSGNATYAQANYKTDKTGDDVASFTNNKIILCPNAGISPNSAGNIPPGSAGVLYYRITILDNPAGSSICNYATITGANFTKFDSPTICTNVATNFGGKFSYVSDMSNTPQPTYFSVWLTNKGNVVTSFKVKLTNLNSNIGLGNWTLTIVSNNNDTIISNINNLGMNQGFPFRIKVVPGASVSVNDWVEFRLKAQAGNNTTATCYTGDDGKVYGGDIGKNWNGVNGANPGFFYQQNNPEIRLTIKPVPLQITSVSPTNNQTGIALYNPIYVTFNNQLNTNTINTSTLYVQDSDWRKVLNVTYTKSGNSVIINPPSTGWQPNEYYTVTVTTNVYDSLGSNLDKKTNWGFYTTVGNETIHKYRTPAFNNNSFADWSPSSNYTNNCFYLSNLRSGGEVIAYDSGNTQKTQINKIWVTWDATYLYIAYSNAATLSACQTSPNTWWVYVAIDTTRDYRGATNCPQNKSLRTFSANRKPEIFMYFPHLPQTGAASYDDTQNLRLDNSFLWYKWLGSSWSGGTSMGRGGVQASTVTNFCWTPRANYNGQNTAEIRIKWSDIGEVPNRMAISVWISTASNNPIRDYCPDKSGPGPTNWVTIDPDNNGDEIPDKATSFPASKFVIWHDGTGIVGNWEKFEITARDMFNNIVQNYSGIITIDVSMGTPSQIIFTNYPGNDGTFTYLGNGKAKYVWPASDGGIITLMIKDNTAETVNIRVKSTTGLVDDNTEGNLIFTSTSGAQISISKSISNIKLGGSSSVLIPGSTITYLIKCSNSGVSIASNIIIYDKIPSFVNFKSNSMLTPIGWTNEYSTNTSPNQAYNSSDYTKIHPPTDRIKWIRWRKKLLSPAEKYEFSFKVIIR
jgi:uncharacterized repeat protein (TIGR01451 family)